ncbi:MAG: NUDIX domain-containing protein [Candidatus Liptonbacteria bacterium]|nr:NUDIX domain-containing protein [Candidatus Liptonbacteria bacterium]
MEPGKDYIGVGCGALIVNDCGETLLLKRKNRNEIGMWCKPGGAVEYGETVEDAVRREVKEEFGVEIELLESLGFTNQILPAEKEHWVAFHYLARITKGKPRNCEPDKTKEFGWFPIDKLPEPLTQTTREPVEMYLKLYNKDRR